MFQKILLATLALCVVPVASHAQTATPQPAISMHGDVKYKPDFTHLDYTNPDAPKGGTLKINDLGTTVILTTHNKGVIDSLGKRVVVMEKGRIIRDDKRGKYFI